ncbi:hypothetical protein S789_004343 [Salmonella enterica subsp. enterica serovar Gaminara]|nr:hypothetical protein [Salmonella enterica subsp. enterica serovar Sandiego]EDV3220920.1 hypothetical protein [Salmonella enterica subsp. enterica serovar Gaminara]EJI4566829.1 hypothetical protein [Salmonella enterica]EJN8646700.1 hypothetical protein [Salmonella enterica]EJO8842756.1 hypothetical protein [Salmonella enterica]
MNNQTVTSGEKIKKNKAAEIRIRSMTMSLYLFFLVFVITAIIVWIITHGVFNICSDYWLKDPEAHRFKDILNVLMYIIPFIFLSLACGCGLTAIVVDVMTGLPTGFRKRPKGRAVKLLREG